MGALIETCYTSLSFSSGDITVQMAQRFRGYFPVVVDVETAGFNDKTDALLEIAAICLSFDEEGQLIPVATAHHHVEPFEGANIEQSALDFTGIDPFNPLRSAIPEKQALKSVFDLIRQYKNPLGCNRAVLVGHNASFDLGFLKSAVERCRIKRNPFHLFTSFDTATLAGVMLGQTVLAKSCESAGIDFDSGQAHSALYDAEKTAELFCYLVNHYQTVAPDLALAE